MKFNGFNMQWVRPDALIVPSGLKIFECTSCYLRIYGAFNINLSHSGYSRSDRESDSWSFHPLLDSCLPFSYVVPWFLIHILWQLHSALPFQWVEKAGSLLQYSVLQVLPFFYLLHSPLALPETTRVLFSDTQKQAKVVPKARDNTSLLLITH